MNQPCLIRSHPEGPLVPKDLARIATVAASYLSAARKMLRKLSTTSAEGGGSSNSAIALQYNPSDSMRKAALFYNPLSGRRQARRVADVEAALTVLRQAGIEIAAEPTRGQAEASEQARQAIAEGCDTVFACGGDGTVHDVLQGMVGSGAALGIIPLGTANALAHDLGLPLSAVAAARASLQAKPHRISLGRVEYLESGGQRAARFFIVAAGIGVDAHLFYKLNPLIKGRLGMLAYYAKALRLWLTHPLEKFPVVVDGTKAEVSQLLAVRIRNFGGALRQLAPGASLERDDLRLVLFHTRSRTVYLRYVARGLLGAAWQVDGVELVNALKVHCHAPRHSQSNSKMYVEADGELLGTLPAEITIAPDALTVLIPN
ncbi:MAG TPA: diacylglycerol kinase family protein [Terriglobales bacterium]|nr:diacylglycerol kinase family protein [Terriglobales bacterium]